MIPSHTGTVKRPKNLAHFALDCGAASNKSQGGKRPCQSEKTDVAWERKNYAAPTPILGLNAVQNIKN
jgi:hypothetical protein